MIASSFIAADLISINIKIMELSLFRISLIIIAIYMILESFKSNIKISFKFKNNQDIIKKFYFIWLVYSLFSIGWVKDYYSWLRAVFFIGSGFFCITILSRYLKNEKDFMNVFRIIFIMVVLHNLIGWGELLTGNYKFADLTRFDRYNQFANNPSVRIPISMFGNPNDYATFLVIGAFISYMVFLNSNSKISKVSCILTIISSILLLFRTNSRANILGLVLGLLVFILFKYLGEVSIKKIFIAFVIPIFSILNIHKLSNMVQLFTNKVRIDFTTGSDFIKLNLIRNGLYFLKETIGFGTGAGNIEYWMETRRVFPVGKIRNMHNWWMEILVGYGMIIFIGYIFVYYKKFKVLYHSYKNIDNKFIKNTSIGLLSIMGSFVVSSISSSSLLPSQWLWVFWGVVIAYIGYIEKQYNLLFVKDRIQ